MKKKILAMLLAASMVATSVSPVYAADFSSGAADAYVQSGDEETGNVSSAAEGTAADVTAAKSAEQGTATGQQPAADASGGTSDVFSDGQAAEAVTEPAPEAELFGSGTPEDNGDGEAELFTAPEEAAGEVTEETEGEAALLGSGNIAPDMEHAVELTPGMQYEVTVTEEQPYYWFKYTPEEDGEYILTSLDAEEDDYTDTYAQLGTLENGEFSEIADDDDGSGIGNHFKLSASLTGGTAYYFSVRQYNYSEATFLVDFKEKIKPESIEIYALPQTEYWQGIDQGFWGDEADGTGIRIHYGNGTYEELIFDSGNTVTDSLGYTYRTDLYLANDEIIWGWELSDQLPGTCYLTVSCTDSETVQPARIPIQIKSLEELPILAGNEEMSSSIELALDVNRTAYMQFVPGKSGRYKVTAEESEDYDTAVYDASLERVDGYTYELQQGETYYVKLSFSGFNSGDLVHVGLSGVSQVTGLGISGQPRRTELYLYSDVTFNNGICQINIPGLELQAAYADGTTETIKTDDYFGQDSIGTRRGAQIAIGLKDTELSGLPAPGNYTVVFTAGDITQEIPVVIKDAPELKTGESVTVGKNGGGFGYCKFVVPDDGRTHKYSFTHSDTELDSDNGVGVYKLVDGELSKVYDTWFDTPEELESGSYYLVNTDNTYYMDGEWIPYETTELTFQAKEICPVISITMAKAPRSTDVYITADTQYLSDICLPGLELLLTYSDGTTETLCTDQVTGDAAKNKNGDYLCLAIDGGDELEAGEHTITYSLDEGQLGVPVTIHSCKDLPGLSADGSVTVFKDGFGYGWCKMELTDNKKIRFTNSDGSGVRIYVYWQEYGWGTVSTVSEGDTIILPNDVCYIRNASSTYWGGQDGEEQLPYGSTELTFKAEELPFITDVEILEMPSGDEFVLGSSAETVLAGASVRVTYSDGYSQDLTSIDSSYVYTDRGDQVSFTLKDGGTDETYNISSAPAGSYRLVVDYEEYELAFAESAEEIRILSLSEAAAEWDGESQVITYSGSEKDKFYHFTPETTGKYLIYSASSDYGIDPCMTLYDAAETYVDYDDDSGSNNNFLLRANLTAGSDYYFKFSRYRIGEGNYYTAYVIPVPETESIEIVSQPDKDTYLSPFEEYSLKGLTAKITYADGSSETLAYNEKTKYLDYMSVTEQQSEDGMRVALSYGGKTSEWVTFRAIPVDSEEARVVPVTEASWIRNTEEDSLWYRFVPETTEEYCAVTIGVYGEEVPYEAEAYTEDSDGGFYLDEFTKLEAGVTYYLKAPGAQDFRLIRRDAVTGVAILQMPERTELIKELEGAEVYTRKDIFTGMTAKVSYGDGSSEILSGSNNWALRDGRKLDFMFGTASADGQLPVELNIGDEEEPVASYMVKEVAAADLPKSTFSLGETVALGAEDFAVAYVPEDSLGDSCYLYGEGVEAVYAVTDGNVEVYDNPPLRIYLEEGKTCQFLFKMEEAGSFRVEKIKGIQSIAVEGLPSDFQVLYGLEAKEIYNVDFGDAQLKTTYEDGSSQYISLNSIVRWETEEDQYGHSLDYDYSSSNLSPGSTYTFRVYWTGYVDMEETISFKVVGPQELGAAALTRGESTVVKAGMKNFYSFTAASSAEAFTVLGGLDFEDILLTDSKGNSSSSSSGSDTEQGYLKYFDGLTPEGTYYLMVDASALETDGSITLEEKAGPDEKSRLSLSAEGGVSCYGLDMDLFTLKTYERSITGIDGHTDEFSISKGKLEDFEAVFGMNDRVVKAKLAEGSQELTYDENDCWLPGTYQIVFYVVDYPDIQATCEVAVKAAEELPALVSGEELPEGEVYTYTAPETGNYLFAWDVAVSCMVYRGQDSSQKYNMTRSFSMKLKAGEQCIIHTTEFYNETLLELLGKNAVCTITKKDYVESLELVCGPDKTVYYADYWRPLPEITAQGARIRIKYESGKEEILPIEDGLSYQTVSGAKLSLTLPNIANIEEEYFITVKCEGETLYIPVTTVYTQEELPAVTEGKTAKLEESEDGWNYWTFTPETTAEYYVNLQGYSYYKFLLEGQKVTYSDGYANGIVALEAGKTYHFAARRYSSSECSVLINKTKAVKALEMTDYDSYTVFLYYDSYVPAMVHVTYADGTEADYTMSAIYDFSDSYGNLFEAVVDTETEGKYTFKITVNSGGEILETEEATVPATDFELLQKTGSELKLGDNVITAPKGGWKLVTFTAPEAGTYTISLDKAPERAVIHYGYRMTNSTGNTLWEVKCEKGESTYIAIPGGSADTEFTVTVSKREEKAVKETALTSAPQQLTFPYGTTREEILEQAKSGMKLKVTYEDQTTAELAPDETDVYGNKFWIDFSEAYSGESETMPGDHALYYWFIPYNGTGKRVAAALYTINSPGETVSITDAAVSGPENLVYNGTAVTPQFTVTLTKDGQEITLTQDRDYTVTYTNNNAPGTASAEIKGKGAYTGTITKSFAIGLAAPVMDSAQSAGYDSIKLAWGETPGAESYTVYQKSGSTWKEIQAGITETSYTCTGLTTGTEYTFTVKAVCKDITSGYADALSAEPKLDTVELGKVSSAAYNKLKITWTAVPGADGYRVYRKEGSRWKQIGTTSETEYTQKSSSSYPVKTGVTYQYTVRAYRTVDGNTLLGGYSKTGISGKAVPNRPVIVSVKGSAYNKLKITWKKASGATAYVIYRKNGSSWQKIATVKGGDTVSYTHTSSTKFPILTGTTYTYTVRSYTSTGKTYGLYNKSGMSGKTYLSKPVISTVKAVSGGLSVQWKAVSGATGYVVYRYEGGKWVKKAATRKLYYIDKTARKGTTYKYRVRAYRTQNGKNVYSSYSTTKSGKR